MRVGMYACMSVYNPNSRTHLPLHPHSAHPSSSGRRVPLCACARARACGCESSLSPCVNCDVRLREPYVSMGASWESSWEWGPVLRGPERAVRQLERWHRGRCPRFRNLAFDLCLVFARAWHASPSCPVAVHFLQRRESNTTKCPNARKGRVPDRLGAARIIYDATRRGANRAETGGN